MHRSWFLALLLSITVAPGAFSQGNFIENVRVQQESRIDWKYAAAQYRGSTELTAKYDSRRQQYDLYGPAWRPPGQLPLILFISPGKVPLEWKQFAPSCQKHGVLFAGVRSAGNNRNPALRVRAALDVLDDVRRRYRVDPDRTYIAGFSGGATIASRLAFALPENFGGLFCIGQRVIPPRTEALIDRASERIHVAALCGGKEPVGPYVEHVDQRVCQAYGFRCRSFVSQRLGHRMPKAGVIELAFQWLEEGVPSRRALAGSFPATRIDSTNDHDATLWRKSLLKEAEKRWAAKQYSVAVQLLQWIETRWPDSDAANQAATRSQQLVEQPEFLDDQSRAAKQRKSKLDATLFEGYEKLANDRRAWFTPEHRVRYAKEAIRLMETADFKVEGRSVRLEKLREIVEKGE